MSQLCGVGSSPQPRLFLNPQTGSRGTQVLQNEPNFSRRGPFLNPKAGGSRPQLFLNPQSGPERARKRPAAEPNLQNEPNFDLEVVD